jgi:hypothetical protein
MLAIQDYLRGGRSTGELASELGINVYEHPELPLVGFKYSQINSPKTHPVVRDCRGIVLERGSWDVVAKPFRRFFNAGEDHENFQHFDWSNVTVTTKEDGSLILLYRYKGEWHVNTSGSFGLGKCGFSGKTWRELFWETSRIDRDDLKAEYTYIFEMWTPYNKVIRTYERPATFLLSMFDMREIKELAADAVDDEAEWIGVPRPERHRLNSMDEIAAYLRDMESRDKTYEGVVVHGTTVFPDGRTQEDRYKIKTDTYLALHHLLDNGNLFNPKRLVPLVLAGECDEVVAYIPEIKPHVDAVSETLRREYDELMSVWRSHRQIEGQKDFALAIVGKTKFKSLLFNVRKKYGVSQSEQHLADEWRAAGELITKVIYERQSVAVVGA